jgi:oligoendopeptidase F
MTFLDSPRIGSWKLTDLVKTPRGKDFQEILTSIQEKVKEFENRRKDLSDDISISDFENLIHDLEEIMEKVNIVSGFAHLNYSVDTSSNEASALLTQMDLLASNVTNRLLFFDLWFKKHLNEETAHRLITSVTSVYKEYLKHKRMLSKYALSEPEEKIISTLEVTGMNGLLRIYERMTNGFEFEVVLKRAKNKPKRKVFSNKEKLLSLIRSPKPEEREAAYKSLLGVYKKNRGILGDIYQNRVLQWHDEYMSLRNFVSPIAVRNVYNNLDDATVDSLLKICRKNVKVFQTYFTEKAKMLGVKRLGRYHLYAPLSVASSTHKKYSYGQAIGIMLKAFENFDPQFRDFAERVLMEEHVDSEIRNNKQGGAFCSTISPKKTPYVLLNFDGRSRDVSTMAHEFGHAIHSMIAADKPISVHHAPLPLAETASVFAEMLLNDVLSKKLTNKECRLILAEQIDDMYATIMRQAFFTRFEIDAHNAIADKNATIEQVSSIYLQNLREQFDDSISVTDDFQWEWLYIPHFYHTPFYCYAYTFGNLLVLSLYQQFKLEGQSFLKKYYNILSAGGSRKPEDLLKESGIKIDDEFWQQGFDLVADKIRQLRDMN